MVDMYANFDCALDCPNVFEGLASLLSKNSFPVNSPLATVHLLSLEGLLVVVHGIADRCTAPSSDNFCDIWMRHVEVGFIAKCDDSEEIKLVLRDDNKTSFRHLERVFEERKDHLI